MLGSMLNLFGEDVRCMDLSSALDRAVCRIGIGVADYAVATRWSHRHVSRGSYVWYIETEEVQGAEIRSFERALDQALCALHPRYAMRRQRDVLLLPAGSCGWPLAR